MKALTMLQPWAWAITEGGKQVENRGWPTRHRGRIAIHAGAVWDPRAVLAYPPLAEALNAAGRDFAWLKMEPPRGAVVGVAQLVDCHPSRGACCTSPWAQRGNFHFVLNNVRTLPEPVPVLGRQRFWDLNHATLQVVLGQLPERTCRECGCTDDAACDGGCSWVPGQSDLCTACAVL